MCLGHIFLVMTFTLFFFLYLYQKITNQEKHPKYNIFKFSDALGWHVPTPNTSQ